MHRPRPVNFILFLLLSALALGAGNGAQEPAESSTTSTPFTMKVQRNEVPVRVIVRDRDGRPVRNLTKDDFRILDNGKPQVIAHFSTEGEAQPSTKSGEAAPTTTGAQPAAIAPKIADRFVAFYFDDLVMEFDSIARSRQAVEKYLQTSLQPSDRVGVFSSSGQAHLDFTADRDKLQEALLKLGPLNRFAASAIDCPSLSDYEAYEIDEGHDPTALQVATAKVIGCMCGGDSTHCSFAPERAAQAARQRWLIAEQQQLASLRGLQELVLRLAATPGQRTIVFISSGFMIETQSQFISPIIDHAIRAGVIVNAIDARGLYTIVPGGDATTRGSGLTGSLAGAESSMQMSSALADSDVMAEFADGTGGVFFHNNNDLEAGLRQAGGLSEFSYLLTFSPSEMKPNGKFHKLKVSLVGAAEGSHLNVQARRGYFAATLSGDPAEREKEQLTDAIFSRSEMNSERLRIATRFFKPTPEEAKVTIMAHLDTQALAFRMEGDRHVSDVTFVTAIFDSDGNFVQGLEKSLTMRLRDDTLNKIRSTGISMATDFDIPPGTYLVREVVRDDAGEVSTLNGTMEIPY